MVTPGAPIRRDLTFLRRRVKPGRTIPIAVNEAYTAPSAVQAAPVPPAPAPAPTTAPVTAPDAAPPVAPSTPGTGAPVGSITRAPGTGAPVGSITRSPGTGAPVGSIRPATPAAAAAGAPAPAGATGARTARRASGAVEPFAAPPLAGVRELGEESPVLRLNARQAAIGTLVVSGAALAVWESDELVTGLALPDGTVEGTLVTTPGNRPLVAFDDGDALITLRHLRRLRRALFVGSGAGPLGVQLWDGSQATVEAGAGNEVFALSLLRVGELLELRAEPVRRDALAARAELLRAFDFVLTAQLAGRAPRRS